MRKVLSFQSLGVLRKVITAGPIHEALQVLEHMDQQELQVPPDVFSCILQRCINKNYLTVGRKLHWLIMRKGMKLYAFLGSHLIRMFTSCESLSDAKQVFNKLHNPNVFVWSAIISAHTELGQDAQAINLFNQMDQSNVKPDGHLIVAVLKACGNKKDLTQGRLIHALLRKHGFESNAFVGSALINMYSKCERLEDGYKVFGRLPKRDVIIWSALISGYALYGRSQEALQFFKQMQQERVEPDNVTFISVLKTCSDMEDMELGRLIHSYASTFGYESHLHVGNILVYMYSKSGMLEDARRTFDSLRQRDVVTWSAMLSGYAEHEHGQHVLLLFQQMEREGMEPSQVTFVCLLRACSSLSAQDQGMLIHGRVLESVSDLNIFVGNAIIYMYIKCGSPENAYKVFINLPSKNIVTWNAMISGFTQHSDYSLAKQCYESMQHNGVKPNSITYICLLGACSRVGLITEGGSLFQSMMMDHGIIPKHDHYSCMVDLLGRSGCLNEAEDLLRSIPVKANTVMWMSLLNHCRIHGKIETGSHCFDHVISEDHRHAPGYVVMSDIYSNAGRWNDAEKVEELRCFSNSWKRPAAAFIEVGEEVHDFVVEDEIHPQIDVIYKGLKRLHFRIKEEGCFT